MLAGVSGGRVKGEGWATTPRASAAAAIPALVVLRKVRRVDIGKEARDWG
jgi:hypothetical protein